MSVIDEYLKKVAEPQKSELERIRKIVHETVPEANEVISYGMPAFKYKNHYLIGFNALKDHMSIFPTSGPIEALKDKLQDYSLSKGTIRFTLDNSIPEPLVKEVLFSRLADIS